MLVVFDCIEIVFCFFVEFLFVNFGGKVYGGVLMKWIDEVVYVCVVVWLSCYCVMVSVGNICF